MHPFSLLPLSLAAHAGRVDGYESQQLIAAGLTLLQRSVPLVRALSGKRAAILMPTSPGALVALAASEGRGAVLINPLASRSEISYQLADANVGVVFTVSALRAGLPDGFPHVLLDSAPRSAVVVAGGTSREVDLGSHVGLSLEGDTDVAGSDDEAIVVYTSAMAGRPLGAILSHRNLLSNARATADVAGFTPADRVLALLPFSHLFGMMVTAASPLLAGASVETVARFNPARVIDLLAAGEITVVAAVPAVYRALLAAMESRGEGARTTALRLCICGGAPLPLEMQDRWLAATGVELRQGYGLTEGGPVCLFNRADRPNERGTLGRPLPGVDVQLLAPAEYDATGIATLGAGPDTPLMEGEICVRGENVFRGYVNGAAGGLPVRNGWLHTGDLGRRNESGAIEFAGLVKPMFTRNGFNIYPREIERAVLEMPGVKRAEVTEVPAEGKEPGIGLVVEGEVSVEAVKGWCAERVSGYKQPTVVRVE